MTHTLTLDEADMRAAIMYWLYKEKGYSVHSVYFSVTEEDRTRDKIVSASVSVTESR